VLRLDSRGSTGRARQQRPAAPHYFDAAKPGGAFRPGTSRAVVASRKVQGLTPDGITGPATGASPARPDVPAARNRPATTPLEVNLARQVIYYVSAGTIQRIIEPSAGSGAWYYSQGRQARAITPAGRYRIYWRYPGGWQPGPLGSMYRPDYFHGGYAVHGMTSVPAYPASHGCVLMTVPAMDRMRSSQWTGMPVAIYSSSPMAACSPTAVRASQLRLTDLAHAV
jgi:lipoprotein-anchoring transpeptidase ErfK/SrfK